MGVTVHRPASPGFPTPCLRYGCDSSWRRRVSFRPLATSSGAREATPAPPETRNRPRRGSQDELDVVLGTRAELVGAPPAELDERNRFARPYGPAHSIRRE